MTLEGTEFDKKSLRLFTKHNPDWDELAKDCVAFSNARGGRILIGIEDDAEEPSPGQKVLENIVEAIAKRIPQITLNVGVLPRKMTASNGSEYIEVQVFRSAQSVASMSDGRYFIRVSDESRPLLPDELTRLIGDKTAYVWEAQAIKNVPRNRFDQEKLNRFVDAIQQSDRVSDFIKAKTVDELLDHYVEPGLLRKLNFRGRTSLRGIEKHRLQELIIKDLEIYREAGISDIQNRIGLEIPRHKIRRELGKLRKQGIISTRGSGRWTKYLFNKTP